MMQFIGLIIKIIIVVAIVLTVIGIFGGYIFTHKM